MDIHRQLPSDSQLIVAARGGMDEAWNELVRRHGQAVAGVARARRRRRSKKASQRALDRLHAEILAGELAPDGDPAVRAVRPRAIALLSGEAYGPDPEDDRDVAEAAELRSLARAFAVLPEQWQTALWHRTIELQPAAEFAPLLGRTANEAGTVVQRAEAGLFEGFLRDQLDATPDGDVPQVDPECAPIMPLLGASMRSTLSAHQERLVEDHLERRPNPDGEPGCAACRRRLAVMRALPTLLPAAIVPGVTGLSVQRYRAAVGVRPQPAGVAAIDQLRIDRNRRMASVAALVVVLIAATAAVVLVRNPFDADSSPSTTAGGTTASTDPSTTEPDTTIPPGSTDPTATTTSTTEVELRPTVDGPENRIEIVFAAGARPIGFAPTEPDLTVELSTAGPIFAGGTGTLDMAITNNASEPTTTNFTIKVPRGVVFDRLVDGDAECVDPVDDSAFCNVAVPAAATVDLSFRLRLTSSVVGRLIVESSLLAERFEATIVVVSRLVYSSIGRGDVEIIGNTLMTCLDTDPVCEDARNGVGDVVNRWDIPTEFIQAVPAAGWENSSSATLDVGDAGIDAAFLFWSGDLKERGQEIPDDGSNGQVSMLAPNAGLPVNVAADRVRLGDIDATQYLGFADITDIVRAAGSGDYLVGNVQSVEVQGSYAGWSIVVVTADDSLPRRQLLVTSPFVWFSPSDVYRSEVPVPDGSGAEATLDVLGFEGELGFVPEMLTVGDVPLGDQGMFDSTLLGARDPSFVNNFGIDIDTYDLVIDAPDGILPIEATSGKDGIRIAVLGLTVDVE